MSAPVMDDVEVILELFAGPGGWSTGLRMTGYDGVHVGLEWNGDACATGAAAGHIRVQVDIAKVDPRLLGKVLALICSPPCQGFSMAGKGRGREDAEMLLAAVAACETADDVDAAIDYLRHEMKDTRSLLVLEPLRYLLALRPEWTAWEQVPAVLPIWQACAKVLEKIGYSVAVGNLQSEQYGVPQTRKRAILVASRVSEARLPEPTHSKYYPRTPAKLDEGLPKWVSMAEALHWGMTNRPYPTVAGGTAGGGQDPMMVGGSGARAVVNKELTEGRWVQRSNYSAGPSKPGMKAEERGRTEREVDQPSVTVTSKAFNWSHKAESPENVEYVNGTGANAARRPADKPAPTVHFGHKLNTVEWEERNGGPAESPEKWEAGKNMGAGMVERHGDRPGRDLDAPAFTVRANAGGTEPGGFVWREKEDSGDVEYVGSSQPKATRRDLDQPAPTVAFGNDMAGAQWREKETPEDWEYAGAGQTARHTSGQRPRPTDEPAHTVTGKGTAAWTPRDEPQKMVKDQGAGMVERYGATAPRGPEQPAFTITGASGGGSVRYHFEPADDAPAAIERDGEVLPRHDKELVENGTWPANGPAPTICGDSRVFAPGGHHTPGAQAKNSTRVSVQEAAILQSFPADYPWRGTKTSQYTQVGDAVPPLLAAHVLAQFISEEGSARVSTTSGHSPIPDAQQVVPS